MRIVIQIDYTMEQKDFVISSVYSSTFSVCYDSDVFNPIKL